MRFFGQHGIQLASVYHFVSNFNAHFRDACFVFADEVFWPGDKSADGTLKRLITEPTLFIERKGKDGVTTTNRTHLMMASNEDWIIPATAGERRYFVLNVSDHKQQDFEWFRNMNRQMEEGGLEAMLHDLLNMEITSFNPRKMPTSTALLDQQEANMEPLPMWWREILEIGIIPKSHYGRSNWGPTAELISDAKATSTKLHSYLNPKTFATFMKKMGCTLKRHQNVRGYDFPDLAQARLNWEKTYPGTVWEEVEIDRWQAEINPAAEEIKSMIADSESY